MISFAWMWERSSARSPRPGTIRWTSNRLRVLGGCAPIADTRFVGLLQRSHFRPPDTYAARRYRAGLRSWRRAVRGRILVFLAPPFLAAAVWGISLHQPYSFLTGFAAGGIAAIVIWLRDVAPPYVENWRQGAEGEAQTHRTLAGNNWTVLDDIDTGKGNLDHVVVVPGGVFLLETKNPIGVAEIRAGTPWVHRHHDPDGDYALKALRPHLLADAAELSGEIQRRAGQRTWVDAVVVFWSEFPQGVVEANRLTYVHGSQLRDWLAARPARLEPAVLNKIAAAVTALKHDGETARPEARSRNSFGTRLRFRATPKCEKARVSRLFQRARRDSNSRPSVP
jgi:hypothetical protein